MKLKNKRTGEIVEPYLEWCSNSDKPHSLAELNEEWEDYKEPKMYWAISMYSENGVDDFKWPNGLFGDDVDKFNKEIGNYFVTREEAEKAVEKLKAWKRLKDNGLVIKKWSHTPDMHLTTGSFLKIEGFIPAIMKNMEDLDLLFSQEDD